MKIEREILSSLLKWKESRERLPLIVQGARQIGKSWAVEEFGRRHFRHTAVFNFDKTPDLKDLFSRTKDVNRILGELELFSPVPLTAGDTLIFFDEIQECPEALNSLKYFAEDAPEYHVVAAGSLLGVAMKGKQNVAAPATFPVGKVQFAHMHPVTFREYLRMADSLLFERLEARIGDLEPLSPALFNPLAEHYRQYQVCGGLPKPCSDMLSGEGLAAVESDLQNLRMAYEFDFSKHVLAKDIPRIHEVWRSIPSQLSKENKKFIFRVVREGARAREYENALNWLVLSGLVHRVYCTEKPLLPLTHYEDTTAFKVYLLDQAVLRQLSGLPPEAVLAKGNLLREFKGAMAENYVLGSLLAQGYQSPHYWTLQGNRAEVDFLIQHGLEVIPIEVKAEGNVAGKSLIEYNRRYEPRRRVRLSMLNVKRDGNLLNLPLFMCDWLKDILSDF